ncbi:hypothetical protein M8C21_025558 [Ambrosia artemisiifolia]|uniref:Uncharacterized protein n=1 Tax=Ambrosia artemisiifolia TaxID=4212 RepID=A0AAD5CGX3_AMBAR|nr:hypothetical protein M8C21_025558 [Ambrosia artemisiifolia]
MVMLCFLLDLRTLSPPLLRDLKQSLLQLANFYAISSPGGHKSVSKSKSLRDKIGICYVVRNRVSCSTEMKVAYRPSGNFSLRDFHHAVNNLPIDAFLPELNNSIAIPCSDAHLETVLSDKVIYSWGGDNEDVGRKVIVISSCLLENLDSVAKKALTDAADKCVSVDFVLLEQVSNGAGSLSESINNFVKNICDLENCSFRNHLPEWLNDLRDEAEELQGRLKFKRNIVGSLNQICCNLIPSFNPIIDEFEPCKIEVRDYNPIPHERGFHQKLNVLVKESLHFGSLPSKSEELPNEPTSSQLDTLNESGPLKQSTGMLTLKEEIPPLDLKSGQDKITARITEEWEQLIVNEIPNMKSPTSVSKPKLDNLAVLPLESNKPLDEKTSRILERLEVPRKLKAKVASPVITSSSAPTDACMSTKKPLIPYKPIQNSVIGPVPSQPMKPNFQRLKRKK